MRWAETREPSRRCLRLDEWPEPDRLAWKTAMAGGDIFDHRCAGANWSAATRVKNSGGYGRWLGFLKQRGWLAPETLPANRVTAARVQAYFESLRAAVRDHTVICRIAELAAVMRAIAPDRDWSWINRPGGTSIRMRLPMARRPMSVPSAQTLLALGLRLMQTAEGLSRPTRRIVQYRDGLLFALLAAVPTMRLRNLVSIQIGRHLLYADGQFRLWFPADETKTRRPLEAPVPDGLAAALRRYLEVYRPQLLQGRAHAQLWVNWRGQALTKSGIQNRFRYVTAKHLGSVIGPHAFRHAAATTVAIKDPAHVRIIAPILGHSSHRTAEVHYNRATTAEAAAALRRSLRKIRKDTRSDASWSSTGTPRYRKEPT
jgi:integrase/recombinase XerD